MAGPIYFISDVHLGSSPDPSTDEPRLARLIPFLKHVKARGAQRLYILGDLFDFWFEYSHVMPWRHFRVLAELKEVTESGVPVTFIGGNHDWWAGRVFRVLVGMECHRTEISVEHQGKRLYLAHGDGLASSGDSGYALMKKVLRNRWVVRALRLVHPDLAYSFGHRLSRFSRSHLTNGRFAVSRSLGETIDRRLAAGHDAFLMGHLHARHREERANGTLFILGDWMTLFSALRLEDGEFRWEDWSTGGLRDGGDAPTVVGGHGDERRL